MNNIEIEELLIGNTLDEAERLASSNGFYLRIAWQDGNLFYGTCDFDERRIDVYVKNGIIIDKNNLLK